MLHEVSLDVAEGEAVTLLGRHGVGKTTLIATAIGATRLFGGRIAIGGRDATRLPPEARAALGLGWVPQERNIFGSPTLEGNLTDVARPGVSDEKRVQVLFPPPGGASAQPRLGAVGQRPADAGDGPRTDAQPAAAAGRAAGGLAPVILQMLPEAIDKHAYPDLDGLFADLGNAYNAAVKDFAAAGCRYLQLDEVNIAYLCDPKQLEMLKNRGDWIEGLLDTYAKLINRSIEGRPADMFVSMHLCRGNFRSMHIASGGYDPVAEVLFNGIDVDCYFLEYDDERSGSFAPLRFLPKGKTVVLGLVTSKRGELETKDELKRRIEEAAKHAPLDQLALSPQCGFASTEEGNLITVEQQWAKLQLCVEVAQEIWGGV